MHKKILFSFLLLQIIFSTNISGIVQNIIGEKLYGVNVFIPILNKGTSSNSEGFFNLEKLPQNSVEVHFRMLGYESQIHLLKTESHLITVTMKESIIKMEPIVVYGGFMSNQDKSAFKITSVEIEKLKFSGEPSINLALANEPGIEVIKLGNSITKPVIRGLSGNRVMILFQGAKTANQAWGNEHGVFIPEEGIEKIEIIKGPASLLYGSEAMAGIINFIPKRALIEDKRETNISFSTYSASKGFQSSLISQKKRKSWFHTYGLGYQNYADYQMPNTQYAKNSRYTHHYAFGNWGVSKNWGIIKGIYSSSYTLAGLVESISNNLDSRGIDNPWQKVGDHFVTTETTFWIKNWTIQPFISYQLNHRKEFNKDDNMIDELPQLLFSKDFPSLDMSLRTRRFDFKSSLNKEAYDFVIGVQGMVQSNTNYVEQILVPDAITKDIGVYTFLNKKIAQLQIQTGVRGDQRIIQFDDNNLEFINYTYSLGGTYKFKNQVYRLNFAKGFRAPNLYELSANGIHYGANRYEKGNIDLLSEENLEIDISLHIYSNQFVFDLALFNNKIKNYIYLNKTPNIEDDFSVYEHFQNNSRLYGGEVGIDIYPYFLTHTHFKTVYSTVTAKNIDKNESLPMIPANSLNHEIIYESDNCFFFDNISSILKLNYHFKQNQIGQNEAPTVAYFLTDVGIKLSKKNHEISIHLNNLLNTEYIPHLSLLKESHIYEQGRNFVMKYSVKI